MNFMTIFMTIITFLFPWLNMETQSQPQKQPEVITPPAYVESAPGFDDDIIEVGDDYVVSCQNPAVEVTGRLVETRGDKFVVEVSGTYTGTSTLYTEADGINTRLHVSSDGTFCFRLEVSAGATITVDTF